MFLVEELADITERPAFLTDYNWVRSSLAAHRIGRTFPLLEEATMRLLYFVESVLSSAPSWQTESNSPICRIAAEIAEFLSECSNLSEEMRRKQRIRSALLYELSDLPALVSAVIRKDDLSGLLDDLLLRTGAFKHLSRNGALRKLQTEDLGDIDPLQKALSADALSLAEYEQGKADIPGELVSQMLGEIAKHVSIGLSATEINAFSSVIKRRFNLATRSNIQPILFSQAQEMEFPAELWPTQIEAIRGGLLDPLYDSWGFAAPTGTGKTFLARLLILNTLRSIPQTKILYIVPSKALVREVSMNLAAAFKHAEYEVVAVSPQLIGLDDAEDTELSTCSVAVLTPEKADLLVRLGVAFISDVSLVIVDEAHHIEASTRGVLLEMYLWRIKRILEDRARVVFLSAVAPNIRDLADWLGKRPGAVVINKRSTRMRVGVYRVRGTGNKSQGWIDYSDGTSLRIINAGIESTQRRGLVQLAEAVSKAGPVLVVAKGKGECENLAQEMHDWLNAKGLLRELSDEDQRSAIIQRLDSRLEREMYASVEMRKLIKYRIAYHHAGLPPRVRIAVEDAIRANYIDYVFATTTLAEGVNFPFSTVIVQSLALRTPPEKGRPSRYHPVTPRSFWNIAGRAGRPGYDKEGQAILFEPSLGLDKIKAVLGDYLDPSITGVEPVRSALATGLNLISEGISENKFNLTDLNNVVIPQSIPREVHGTVNLLRVGIIHARASKITNSPEEIVEGSFAARQMNNTQKSLALRLIASQNHLVDDFIASTDALPIEIIAEIGLSLETLSSLREYVASVEDWQIEHMRKVMIGGRVNHREAPFVIGPLAARMSELEGQTLSGINSEIILQWLSGVPFTVVRSVVKSNRLKRIEDLISAIYSRIQYMLPWGLYAMHRIVKDEASNRKLQYNDEIKLLAYLSDAGVPSFNALRLVGLNFERVDATRLAEYYQRLGGLLSGVDVVGWIIHENKAVVERCVRGRDNRRLDYDLFALIDELKSAQAL